MSPDTGVTNPTRRRAWRVMSAVALLTASATLLLTVVLFIKVQENRIEANEGTCKAIETLKSDLRNTLDQFGVQQSRLPRHADGTYAFEPLHVSCRKQAQQQVNPPNEK